MTLAHKGTKKGFRVLYVLSGRIPHHATIEKSQKILESWRTTLNKGRVLLGLDANETFHDPDDTGPGSNRAEESWVEVTSPTQIRSQSGWGFKSKPRDTSRTSHGVHVWKHRPLAEPPTTTRHPSLASPPWQDPSPWQARGWTDSGRSQQLKELRQNARTSSPSTAKSKKTWWKHRLVDDPAWQSKLKLHFEGIFAKVPRQQNAARIDVTRQALARLCKQTPWRLLDETELRLATVPWKRGKSTGPNNVSRELLLAMLQSQQWTQKLLSMFKRLPVHGDIL